MKRALTPCAVLLLAACSEQMPGPSTCADGCNEGARCDVMSQLCVVNLPPTVRIDRPAPGSFSREASLSVEGVATDDEGALVSAEISTDGRQTWARLEVRPDGNFAHPVQLPPVDNQVMVVHLRVRDGSGLMASAETSFTIDRVNPACTLVAPVEGQRFAAAQGDAFEIKVNATDGSGIGVVEVSMDDGATFAQAFLSGAEAKLDWQLPRLDAASRTVIARVRDSAGNSCQASATVEVDNIEPKAAFLTPAPAEVLGLSKGPAFEVRISASDGSGTPVVELSTDDGASFAPLPITLGEGSFSWLLPPKMDGAMVKLALRATDKLGNVTRVDRQVMVDQVVPSCAFVTPAPGQVLNKAGGQSLMVEWAVTDGSGFVSPSSELSLDDGAKWTAVSQVGGGWSTLWTLNPTDDGVSRTLRARGVDAAGNPCAEASVTAVVDLMPPVLTIASPAGGVTLGPAAVTQADFQGQVSDGRGPVAVSLNFGDGAGPRTAAVSSGGWSVTVPLPLEDYVAHQASVSATDAAGNASQAVRAVWVDRVAPSLSVTAPAQAQKFNIATLPPSGAVRAQWTASDGNPVVVVELDSGSGFQGVSGASFDIPTSPTDNPATYTCSLRARDPIGNEATASRSFHVDRVRPTIVAVAPPNGSRAVPPSPTYSPSVTFSEWVSTVPAAAVISLSPVASGASGQWAGATWTLSGLAHVTSYQASVNAGVVEDAFGNANAETRSWRFANPVRLPPVGALLTLENPTQFSAAADEDGAFWFATEEAVAPNCPPPPQPCLSLGSRTTNLHEVAPVSGVVSTYQARIGGFSSISTRLRLSASRSVTAQLDPFRRVALNTVTVSGGSRAGYWMNTGIAGLQKDSAVMVAIPAEQHLQESGSSLPLGFVYSSLERYLRLPNPAVTLGFAPNAAFAGPLRSTIFLDLWRSWMLVEERGDGSFSTARLECSSTGTCGVTPAQPGSPAHWSGYAATPNLSVAMSTAGVALVADKSDGVNRSFLCDAPCSGGGACIAPSESSPASQGLRVAPAFNGGKILGARRVGGSLELLQRDMSNRCANPWTVIRTVAATPSHWEPLMLGNQPALLYVEGAVVYLSY